MKNRHGQMDLDLHVQDMDLYIKELEMEVIACNDVLESCLVMARLASHQELADKIVERQFSAVL